MTIRFKRFSWLCFRIERYLEDLYGLTITAHTREDRYNLGSAFEDVVFRYFDVGELYIECEEPRGKPPKKKSALAAYKRLLKFTELLLEEIEEVQILIQLFNMEQLRLSGVPANQKSLYANLCLQLRRLEDGEISATDAIAMAKLAHEINDICRIELTRARTMLSLDKDKNTKNAFIRDVESIGFSQK